MSTQLARLGDGTSHGGKIITGAGKTVINGKPAARKGDLHTCPIPGHGVTPITSGSETLFIEGCPAARVGDIVGCGAVIIEGSPDTLEG